MSIRGIRGAICLQADTAEEMSGAVVELLGEIIQRNNLTNDDLVSVLFTATPDIHSAFPASFAREIGLTDVPLICAQELDITGALKLVIRVLVHANTAASRSEIKHVYLRGAEVLRQDIAQ
ncbi:MAG: chorismate mutase [Actinomycetales bacterium]|nr:chorismate mutase [Actinomycetales bacterium]